MAIVAFRPSVSNRTVFTTLDRATVAFRACLDLLGYNPTIAREACFAIREHQETATLVAMGLIDAEDEGALEAAFADGFDAVPLTSGIWNIPPGRWEPDGHPTPAEALEHARSVGTWDADGAPLPEPDDAEQPDGRWLEAAMWAALVDASRPLPEYLEAELADARITPR